MTIIQKNSKFVKEGEGVTRLNKIEATKNNWWKNVKIGISAINSLWPVWGIFVQN